MDGRLEGMSHPTVFKNVIVGIDTAGGGRDAIGAARTVAPEARLVLTNVYPHMEVADHAEHEAYGRKLRDYAIETLEAKRVAAGIPDAEVVAIADLSPSKALKRFAEDEKADLVVIGPGRRSAVGRLVMGDTCHGVLHGSPCPVLVAPKDCGPVPNTVGTIGVAYDRSPESEHALALAVRLSQSTGAHLLLVMALDVGVVPAVWGFQIADYINSLVGPAQETLEKIAADLPVPATAEVLQGGVATVLRGLALRSDLVVCGSRGWGPAARVAFGSTAERLAHNAPCPVIVVPRGADVTDGDEEIPTQAGAQTA